mmetsp:Transcript_12431/g.31391  ORF Transcript_12431/g.31391 Transcript_12431/m.31391 type:complete len:206 (+) Transcript_12431:346-963(+)
MRSPSTTLENSAAQTGSVASSTAISEAWTSLRATVSTAMQPAVVMRPVKSTARRVWVSLREVMSCDMSGTAEPPTVASAAYQAREPRAMMLIWMAASWSADPGYFRMVRPLRMNPHANMNACAMPHTSPRPNAEVAGEISSMATPVSARIAAVQLGPSSEAEPMPRPGKVLRAAEVMRGVRMTESAQRKAEVLASVRLREMDCVK